MTNPYISASQKYEISHSSNEPDENLSSTKFSSSFIKKCQSTLPSLMLQTTNGKHSSQTHVSRFTQPPHSPNIVENICNQIKYLIEGNLRSNNSQANTIDFVRDNVIPMLIKMFFQGSREVNPFSQSMSEGERFREITNRLGGEKKRHFHSDLQVKQCHQQGFNQTSKSAFLPQGITRQQQQAVSQDDESQNQEPFQINHQTLTKTLCLSILLLKTLTLTKSQTFQRIKSFSHQKYSKVQQLISLIKRSHITFCVKKFSHFKTFTEKNSAQLQLSKQVKLFQVRKMELGCQVIGKVLRMRLGGNWRVFKASCLRKNKWMVQWVRLAALRSPLTVKTSVWRLKNFMESEENVQDEQQIKPTMSVCSKDSGTDQVNIPVQKQKEKQQKLQYESQSQEESISSNQFERMFENQEENESQQQHDIHQKQNEEKTQPEAKQQNWHGQDGQDEQYLITISQDQNQNSSAME